MFIVQNFSPSPLLIKFDRQRGYHFETLMTIYTNNHSRGRRERSNANPRTKNHYRHNRYLVPRMQTDYKRKD